MSIVESALGKVRSNATGRPTGGARGQPAADSARIVAPVSLPAIQWPASSRAPLDISTGRLQELGLFSQGAGIARVENEMRPLRREVVGAAQKINPSTGVPVGPIVAVTSAFPGEGKSFTSMVLAQSVAAADERDVLLVDGDCVRQTISSALVGRDEQGFADLLRHEALSPEALCLPTTRSRLRFLPAGAFNRSDLDLFSADRIGRVCAALAELYRSHLVIIDLPPVLVSDDAATVANAAGQVLLVVRAGVSLQDSVLEAVKAIGESVPIGVVLNDWKPDMLVDKRAYESYGAYNPRS